MDHSVDSRVSPAPALVPAGEAETALDDLEHSPRPVPTDESSALFYAAGIRASEKAATS